MGLLPDAFAAHPGLPPARDSLNMGDGERGHYRLSMGVLIDDIAVGVATGIAMGAGFSSLWSKDT